MSANISEIIRKRQTWKVLGDPRDPVIFPEGVVAENNEIVKQAIATAGWAPFHYDRNVDTTPEPWRAYLIDASNCREIAKQFSNWFDNVKPNNKLPPMLAACGAVVLVTWIPQFRNLAADVEIEETPEKQRLIDDEHLAATAAFVQNLLLVLTAEGLGTYWSSGGQLGSPPMFDRLGISQQECLVAAVFVEYPNGNGPVKERIAGKHRERRSPMEKWFSVPTMSFR